MQRQMKLIWLQIFWLGLIFTHVAKEQIFRGEDEVKATAGPKWANKNLDCILIGFK